MNLGGLDPQVMRNRIVTASANQPQQASSFAPVDTNPVSQVNINEGKSFIQPDNDPMKMLKKYAPFIIGAIVLYYIISKK